MKKKTFLLLSILIIVIALSFFSYIGYNAIKYFSNPEAFRIWVNNHGVFGYLAYALLAIIQIVACFIPGEPFEFISGYAFGPIKGTIICLLSEALGSILVITLTRKFGKKLVRYFFSEEKINSLKFLKTDKHRFIVFSILFILPGTPKDLLCYYAGLTDIPFIPLSIICSFGRIPSVVTSTLLAGAVWEKEYLISIIIFSITILLSLSGLFIYKKMSEKK